MLIWHNDNDLTAPICKAQAQNDVSGFVSLENVAVKAALWWVIKYQASFMLLLVLCLLPSRLTSAESSAIFCFFFWRTKRRSEVAKTETTGDCRVNDWTLSSARDQLRSRAQLSAARQIHPCHVQVRHLSSHLGQLLDDHPHRVWRHPGHAPVALPAHGRYKSTRDEQSSYNRGIFCSSSGSGVFLFSLEK